MIKRIISKTIDFLYYAIIPFLIIGITLNYTTFQIALVALLVMVILNNRHSVGVFFIMYGGSLAGITRTIYPNIPVYGVVLGAIGFLLIWDLLLDFFFCWSYLAYSISWDQGTNSPKTSILQCVFMPH